MKRIQIIGNKSSGKSTLSNNLGQLVKIPVIHIDQYYWKPGWVEKEENEWSKIENKLIEGEKWILDGCVRSSFDSTMPKADTIIFKDLNPVVCFYRYVKRRLKYSRSLRPGVPAGCNENKIKIGSYIGVLYVYNRDVRPKIMKYINLHNDEQEIIIIRNKKHEQKFLNQIKLKLEKK